MPLNKEQKLAATTVGRNEVVTACAGSGKTHTMTEKVAYMVGTLGIPAASILLVTFTRAAAGEMKSRVQAKLGAGAVDGMFAGTFHSFCGRELRKFAYLVGRNANFTVLPAEDVPAAFQLLMAERGYATKAGFPKAASVAAAVSGAANAGMEVGDYVLRMERAGKTRAVAGCANYLTEVRELASAYSLYKRSRNVVDYDDLLGLMEAVLEENPAIAAKLAARYPPVIVDEYQDTNGVQDRVVQALVRAGSHACVVGDAAQSLYGWRGAEPRNIMEFHRRYKDSARVVLFENYRSSQEILDLANAVMSRHYTGGAVQMHGQFSTGELPRLRVTNDDRFEAMDIVSKIANVRASGNGWTQAVLYRASYSAAPVELALTMAGIPYVKRGGRKFTEQPGVRCVLAILRCMANPQDELAHFNALQVLAGVGEKYAREIAGEAYRYGRRGVTENRFTRHAFHGRLVDFSKLLAEHDGGFIDAGPAVDAAADFYRCYRKEAIDMSRGNEKTIADMQKEYDEALPLISRLQDTVQPGQGLAEFLASVSTDVEADADVDGSKKVILSTIHSAKGLEWDAVYVMDCVAGVMPKATDAEGIQEDLRCFYVAMTRAKRRLVLYAPRQSCPFGRVVKNDVTPFLDGCRRYLREERI